MKDVTMVCQATGRVVLGLLVLVLASPWVVAASASPPTEIDFPDNVYWGDTHVHTLLSGDAYSMGTLATPDDAYRFARGEAVRATGGEMAKLRRPLDFLMVADHARAIGVLRLVGAGDKRILATKDGRKFHQMLSALPDLSDIINAPSREDYDAGSGMLGKAKAAWAGDYGMDRDYRQSVWREVIANAERFNDPGRFTTFTGYEYTVSRLHRNVMFVGGPEVTEQTFPFSGEDSNNPEDLWAHLTAFRESTGSDVIAIPHNSNLSRGGMFGNVTSGGKPFTADYARIRADIEPVVEVTQIKGDSETHPLISPEDPFADYETWEAYRAPAPAAKSGDAAPAKGRPSAVNAKGTSDQSVSGKADAASAPMSPRDEAMQSYVRSALLLGLEQQRKLGVNPFKLGMIGSTDSHTGLAAPNDDNWWGKLGAQEPGPYRAGAPTRFDASGIAAVWAKENTREAIFAAFRRREVYASTGPRIRLRFFGGWGFNDADALRPDLAQIGYRRGVPMGGDLVPGDSADAPSFLVHAARDPDRANLDRVQIVKGWQTGDGKLMERVYDVAWPEGRKVVDGRPVPVRSTVDVETATYTNAVGASELAVHWQDPDFDPDEAAFYYVRVLQIPTPRWTTYDAARYGTDLAENKPVVTQERAYSSPIWYTPD